MEVQPAEEQASESQPMCSQCGSGEIEEGFELPLCSRCRTLLAARPFPAWIKLSCIVLLVIVLIAAVRSANAFQADITFAHGKQAEQQGDFATAADYYEQVAEQFPDSTQALARLAITRTRAGQLPEAARALNRLSGKKISRKLVAELQQVTGR